MRELRFQISTRFYATLMNKSLCVEEKCFFLNTRAADANESDPWPAFLVPSVPNWARRLVGASLRATPESVGPRSFLHSDMASSPISSMTIIGPELTNCTRLLFKKKKKRHCVHVQIKPHNTEHYFALTLKKTAGVWALFLLIYVYE